MRYYKSLLTASNGFITKDVIYRETDHGNNKNNSSSFVTILDWIETCKTFNKGNEFEEVSKNEYLLYKTKEIKSKILDKNNGFVVTKEEAKIFNDIIVKLGFGSNYSDYLNKGDYYIEQHSMTDKYNYRLFNKNIYIEQYNLNLINFKDLIDELKEIRDEV